LKLEKVIFQVLEMGILEITQTKNKQKYCILTLYPCPSAHGQSVWIFNVSCTRKFSV